jgi:hypothetical protein
LTTNLSMIVLQVSGVAKGESRINDRVKERVEDCEEMNNINGRRCSGTFVAFGRKQGRCKNPLANAATSLATTENKQWTPLRNYSIVLICYSYQRATPCLLESLYTSGDT